MKTKLSLALALAIATCSTTHAQNTFPANGNVGIGTLAPATNLQVFGVSRFGAAANYAQFDGTGNLSFTGSGNYKVAGNRYAFQYAGNPNYGLFFNSTNVRYEFRDGAAVSVFYVGANDGNAVFTGGVRIGNSILANAGNLRWTGTDFEGYNGFAWIKFATSLNSWGTSGNSGTSVATNFIGTTDAQSLAFRTSNIEKMRLLTDGKFGIGTTAPNARLHINTTIGEDAFRIQISGSTRFLVNDAGGVTIGSTTEAPANSLFVNGDVGIGIAAPKTNLHIFRGSSGTVTPNANSPLVVENSTNNYISILTPSANEKGIIFGDNLVPVDGGVLYNSSNNMLFQTNGNVTRMTLTASGNLDMEGDATGFTFNGGQSIKDGAGSGFSPIEVHGDLVPDNTASHALGSITNEWTEVWAVDGTINLTSAKTTKNVKELGYGLNEIMKLRPVSYNRIKNPEGGDGVKRIGLLADEVKQVIPEAVKDWKYVEDKSGKVSKVTLEQPGLNMDNLVPVLIKSIQELQIQVTELKKQLNNNSQSIVSSSSNANAVDAKVMPAGASLEQNAPNPFNSSTLIRYHIPATAASAQIMVTNAAGNTVKTFNLSSNGAGNVTINANELSAGSFFYTLIVDGKKADSKQMILVK